MSGDWSDVWWGHSVTSEQLSVWLRGYFSWCDKNKDGPWAVLSTLTTHSVLRGGNFLSCFQTWQSSNALGNDLFAIKLSTLRMYWHRTGYFFLILIACNLEWLLSRLVCQVVSSLMLMARLDTKENISSRRNLTETRTVKDSKVTSWLQIPPAIWSCQDSRTIDLIIVFSDAGSQQVWEKVLNPSQHLLHF